MQFNNSCHQFDRLAFKLTVLDLDEIRSKLGLVGVIIWFHDPGMATDHFQFVDDSNNLAYWFSNFSEHCRANVERLQRG